MPTDPPPPDRRHVYDALGRVIRASDPPPACVSYTAYDPGDGTMLAQGGLVTHFTYDGNGQVYPCADEDGPDEPTVIEG